MCGLFLCWHSTGIQIDWLSKVRNKLWKYVLLHYTFCASVRLGSQQLPYLVDVVATETKRDTNRRGIRYVTCPGTHPSRIEMLPICWVSPIAFSQPESEWKWGLVARTWYVVLKVPFLPSGRSFFLAIFTNVMFLFIKVILYTQSGRTYSHYHIYIGTMYPVAGRFFFVPHSLSLSHFYSYFCM